MSVENRSAPHTPDFDEDGVQRFSHQNAAGQEVPDPVPTTIPIPFQNLTLGEQVQREIIMTQLREFARNQDIDTPEEADDFDIEDDPLDPLTPWEAEFEASQERKREAIRKASEDLASRQSMEKKVEKPKRGLPPVVRNRRSGVARPADEDLTEIDSSESVADRSEDTSK